MLGELTLVFMFVAMYIVVRNRGVELETGIDGGAGTCQRRRGGRRWSVWLVTSSARAGGVSYDVAVSALKEN